MATHEQAKFYDRCGARAASLWQVATGSHADRVAQLARAGSGRRDCEPFEDWVANRRPLRVLLGVDFSLSAEHAMRWVDSLCAFGPCEITAVYLYWPPEQFNRLGLSGVRDYMGPHPEVAQTLQGQLAERLAGVFGTRAIGVSVQPTIGRIADRIASWLRSRGSGPPGGRFAPSRPARTGDGGVGLGRSAALRARWLLRRCRNPPDDLPFADQGAALVADRRPYRNAAYSAASR